MTETSVTKTTTGVVRAESEKIDRETILKYLQNMGNNLPTNQQEQFIDIAQAHNLNPFKREIYGIPYGSNFNIIVGYEVYLKRADKTGTLDGFNVWTEGQGREMVAKIEIFRKDRTRSFQWEVELVEYDQGNSMWKKKPKTMLKKVVVAQAFRLCWPNDFDGMPYIAEEVGSEASIMVANEHPSTGGNVEPERDAEATNDQLDTIMELLADKILSDEVKEAWTNRLGEKVPTVDEAEKAIAILGKKIRDAKANPTPTPEPQPEQTKEPQPVAETTEETTQDIPEGVTTLEDEDAANLLETRRKRFHALGVEIYGDQWDVNRPQLVAKVSSNAKSSKDLSLDHIEICIKMLEAQQEA
jgi:phage recombination protein Bet